MVKVTQKFLQCVLQSVLIISLSSSVSVDPPRVTHHPKSQSVLTGAQATFKVEATGDDLTFQWLKNGSDVHNDNNYSGTDTSTLMIQHVKSSDGGCYSCLVSNEAKNEREVSGEAQLIVCECLCLYWFFRVSPTLKIMHVIVLHMDKMLCQMGYVDCECM